MDSETGYWPAAQLIHRDGTVRMQLKLHPEVYLTDAPAGPSSTDQPVAQPRAQVSGEIFTSSTPRSHGAPDKPGRPRMQPMLARLNPQFCECFLLFLN